MGKIDQIEVSLAFGSKLYFNSKAER